MFVDLSRSGTKDPSFPLTLVASAFRRVFVVTRPLSGHGNVPFSSRRKSHANSPRTRGSTMRSLLLLDDDQAVCDALTRLLVHHGIDVEGCTTPDAFMALAQARNHRALLVDWNLKVCEGTTLIEKLRNEAELRQMGLMSAKVTTAHGEQLALEAGADAYIDKTFDKPFVAAVLSLLEGTSIAAPAPSRRGQPVRSSGTALRAQRTGFSTTIELRGDLVLLHDCPVELRSKEQAVLRCLIENAGSIVSKETLAREVWGLTATQATTLIKTTMYRLRERLGSAGSLIEHGNDGYVIRVANARLRLGSV